MSESDILLLGATADGAEYIRLTAIEAVGFHGVYSHERRDGQPFVVDVTLRLARASRADDVTTTVHYGELATSVAHRIAGPPVDLIETLAGEIADACLAQAAVAAVVVTVHKPRAPIAETVGDAAVTVVRFRS